MESDKRGEFRDCIPVVLLYLRCFIKNNGFNKRKISLIRYSAGDDECAVLIWQLSIDDDAFSKFGVWYDDQLVGIGLYECFSPTDVKDGSRDIISVDFDIVSDLEGACCDKMYSCKKIFSLHIRYYLPNETIMTDPIPTLIHIIAQITGSGSRRDVRYSD